MIAFAISSRNPALAAATGEHVLRLDLDFERHHSGVNCIDIDVLSSLTVTSEAGEAKVTRASF
jgi:hypothetical protein